MIQNAEFSGYYFYMDKNIWTDFQICISVPLTHTRLTEWACRPQVLKYLLYDFKEINNKYIKIIIFRRRWNYEKHAQPEMIVQIDISVDYVTKAHFTDKIYLKRAPFNLFFKVLVRNLIWNLLFGL